MSQKESIQSKVSTSKTKLGDIFRLASSGLGLRMTFLSLMPIAMMCLIIAAIYVQIVRLNNRTTELLSNTVPAVSTSMEIESGLNAVEESIWGAIANSSRPDEAAAFMDSFQSSTDKIASAIDVYKGFEMPPRAQKLREAVNADWEKLSPNLQEVGRLLEQKKYPEVVQLFDEQIKSLSASLHEKLSAIQLNNVDEIEFYKTDSAKQAKFTMILSFLIALIAAGVSLVVSVWLIVRSMRKVLALANRLTEEVEHSRKQSEVLLQSASALSASSTDAMSALDQTSSAVVQMKESMGRTDENATESSQVTISNADSVHQGQSTLMQMRESVDSISSAYREMSSVINKNNQDLSQLLEFINQIIEKTGAINDIVFQTKLLSFNASVESARAAEHGRGFSVVAEEVGKLAQASGVAANEIASLLEGRKKEVHDIIHKTKEDLNRVSANIEDKIRYSQESVTSSLNRLEALSGRSEEIKKLVGGISTAMSEQTTGISEINQAVIRMGKISRDNLSKSQEIAESAETGKKRAESLSGIVTELDKIVRGNS